jgi:hypothetical protein
MGQLHCLWCLQCSTAVMRYVCVSAFVCVSVCMCVCSTGVMPCPPSLKHFPPISSVSCGHRSSVCRVVISHLCVLCGHRSSLCRVVTCVVWSPMGIGWTHLCCVVTGHLCVLCGHLCCVVTDGHRLDAPVVCAHRSSVCRVVTCVVWSPIGTG